MLLFLKAFHADKEYFVKKIAGKECDLDVHDLQKADALVQQLIKKMNRMQLVIAGRIGGEVEKLCFWHL